MKFYKLEIPGYSQYKFAWAEEVKGAKFSDKFPECPICRRAIGQFEWLPPYKIVIKQPRKIGDFVYCGNLTDLIVSENFKSKYEECKLTGLEKFFELEIDRMGTKNDSKYLKPKLFGTKVLISEVRVNYSKMGTTWFSKPEQNICELCCPGGGGQGGIYQTYEKIILEKEISKDFFIPINFSGNIIGSVRAKEFIHSNGFTNVKLTPIEEAKYDMFQLE